LKADDIAVAFVKVLVGIPPLVVHNALLDNSQHLAVDHPHLHRKLVNFFFLVADGKSKDFSGPSKIRLVG
jgi:hypothetical protein